MSRVEELRVLTEAERPQLVELLLRHLESSLILLSNVDKAGVVDHGQIFQATYAGRFDASGALTAVAAHYWNGNVLVQGDAGLEDAVRLACQRSGRAVGGFLGPRALVARARQALGLAQAPTKLDAQEQLFVLELEQLVIPELLSHPGVKWRFPSVGEAQRVLMPWRVAYAVETLGATDDEGLREGSRDMVLGWLAERNLSVLSIDGEIVSMSGFNSRARGAVQVGGVYTPPALRGRGYGRAAVAGSLLEAREAGYQRSTLFTQESNVAAQRAYLALGYRVIGDYALVFF
jgi:predicted GNAT family acetyltransferase